MKTDKTYIFAEAQLRVFIKKILCNNDCPWIEEVALNFAQELDIDLLYAESMGDKDE